MLLAKQFNRPTKTVRVISLSPLARIFQPYADISPYLEDPDLIFTSTEPFKIKIQGSWKTLDFESGEVHQLDESLALAYVGIDNDRLSTDYASSGLVYFDVPEHVSIALEYHHKVGEKLPLKVKKELEDYLARFRALSDKRVLDHCRRLYNTLMTSRAQLKEAGKAPHDPVDMELIIAFILREEVKKQKSRRKVLSTAFDEAAQDIGEQASIITG